MDTQHFHRWVLYVLFCCHGFSIKTLANCYYPNGLATRNAAVYQPCNSVDEASMCCALNRSDPDKCRSDGLCDSTYDGNVWRDSCTDRSWKSPSCIKLCDTGIGQRIAGEDVQLDDHHFTVTPCEDGSYCCGNGTAATACCTNNKGVFLSNGETTSSNSSATPSTSATAISSTSTSAVSSTSTSAVSTSITSSSHATSSSSTVGPLDSSQTTSLPSSGTSAANTQNSNSSKNNTGVIVGVGGIIVLILIIGLILIPARQNKHAESEVKLLRLSRGKLWSLRRAKLPILPKVSRTAVSRADVRANPPGPHEVSGADVRRELDSSQILELDPQRRFHELR